MHLAFDRGTITLIDPLPCVDPRQLPGMAWDARVARYRAAARHHASIRAELAVGGVQFSDSVRTSPPDCADWTPPELRPYQEAALAAWDEAGRRGMVVLPTGAGKTRVAIAAMARCARPSLVVAPTRALVEQWLQELRRHYGGEVGCVGDGMFEVKSLTVATIESAWRHMSGFGNRFELLVVDEAHHFGNGARDEALEMSVAPARLGLTATPPRDERVLLRLGDLIGPIVYELSIPDLAGSHLANFDLATIGLELFPDERERYDGWMRAFRALQRTFAEIAPESTWRELAKHAGRTKEGRAGLDGFRKARKLIAFARAKRTAVARLLATHRDSRVLVFTGDNESAYALAREHLVMPITCDVGRAERESALERFRSGELRALVSSRVLNEGLDVPDADVAIVVAGAMGEREHTQRVGRLLRPRAGKRARVYELVMRRTIEVRQAERRREGLVDRSAAHT